MKIFLKSPCQPSRTKIVQFEEGNDSFGKLLENAVLWIKPYYIGPFEVSLNGKDPLKGSANTPLSSLGLVSGDIIFVLPGEAFIKASSVDAEIRRMSENGEISEPGQVSNTNVVGSGSNTTKNELDPQMNIMKNSQYTMGSSRDLVATNKNVIVNRNLNIPILCQESNDDSVPSSLEQMYKNAHISTANDAFVLVIHLLMGEVGFELMVNNCEPFSMLSCVNGVYKINYRHPVNCSHCCQLVIFTFGSIFTIHGLLLTDVSRNGSPVTITLPLDLYVRTPLTPGVEAKDVYRSLPHLSQQFKDGIARPLLNTLLEDADIRVKDELMSLPTEVKLSILQHLDVHALLAMSMACTEFNELANEEQLWKHLSFLDFKTSASANVNTSGTISWKGFYKRRFLEKRELEKRRQSKHIGICPFIPFPAAKLLPVLPSGGFMPSPLGIVGGDYDRIIAVTPGLPDARPNLHLLNPHPRQPASAHFRFCPHFI